MTDTKPEFAVPYDIQFTVDLFDTENVDDKARLEEEILDVILGDSCTRTKRTEVRGRFLDVSCRINIPYSDNWLKTAMTFNSICFEHSTVESPVLYGVHVYDHLMGSELTKETREALKLQDKLRRIYETFDKEEKDD